MSNHSPEGPTPIVESLAEAIREIGAHVEGDEDTVVAFNTERSTRAAQVKATDLQHELDGAIAAADDLVTHSNEITPTDPALNEAARMAVLEVGQIDVDIRNLPPR